jgi:hypothetical protein
MGISNSSSLSDEEYHTRMDIILNNVDKSTEIRYIDLHTNKIDIVENPPSLMVNQSDRKFPYDSVTEHIVIDILELYNPYGMPTIEYGKNMAYKIYSAII